MAHSKLMNKLDQAIFNPETGQYRIRDISHVITRDGVVRGNTYMEGYNDRVKVEHVTGFMWRIVH